MFSIFSYIMSRVTHSEPGLPMLRPCQISKSGQVLFRHNFILSELSHKVKHCVIPNSVTLVFKDVDFETTFNLCDLAQRTITLRNIPQC